MGELRKAGDIQERAQFVYSQDGELRFSARINTWMIVYRNSSPWVIFETNDGKTIELPADQIVEIIS